MKKINIITLGIILILLLYIGRNSYWFIKNNNNNINISIANHSQSEDSVYVKMYWDEKTLFCGFINKNDWYKHLSFSSSLGYHTLKLVSHNVTEIKQIYVLPIKFIAVEYYGKLDVLPVELFSVTTSSSLIKIE